MDPCAEPTAVTNSEQLAQAVGCRRGKSPTRRSLQAGDMVAVSRTEVPVRYAAAPTLAAPAPAVVPACPGTAGCGIVGGLGLAESVSPFVSPGRSHPPLGEC